MRVALSPLLCVCTASCLYSTCTLAHARTVFRVKLTSFKSTSGKANDLAPPAARMRGASTHSLFIQDHNCKAQGSRLKDQVSVRHAQAMNLKHVRHRGVSVSLLELRCMHLAVSAKTTAYLAPSRSRKIFLLTATANGASSTSLKSSAKSASFTS